MRLTGTVVKKEGIFLIMRFLLVVVILHPSVVILFVFIIVKLTRDGIFFKQ